MSSDERFEEFLGRAARLNEPPAEVPREEMWAVIAAARAPRAARAGGAPAATPLHRDAVSIAAARPRRRSLLASPWIGMAATLVLGLGLGRYMIAREMGTVPAVDTLAVAATQAMGDRAAPVEGPSVPAAAPAVVSRVARGARETRPVEFARRDGGSATYSAASQQHLTRAEALVAVVSAMPADAALDSLTGRWARDILSNTRLLLDSPAGDDPVRRQLLEDLETVLVQLVQRSGRTVEDRAMIDRTLQKTQILTRLRSGATGT